MKTALDRLREFYRSKWYPLVIMTLVVAGNALGIEIWLFSLMVLTILIGCLIAYDLRFAITPFLCTVFFVSAKNAPGITDFREHFTKPLQLTVLIVSFSVLALSILIFIIRNRRRINPMPWKSFLLSMALMCLLWSLNGLFNPVYTISNFIYSLQFPAVLLLIYVLFALYVHFDEGVFDYFMYCLVIAGLVICLELVCRYLSGAVFLDGVIVKELVVLGWGVWTTVGGMIAFVMPACFYFAATHKRGWIFYLLGLFEFFCIILSQSRGAMLVGALILLLCILLLCIFGHNRKINRWISAVLVLIGVLGVVLLWDKLIALLQGFINMGFDDNGRFDLWKTGMEKFLANPILGAGFYDNGIVSDWDIQVYPFFYHNTVVQLLASTGILGTLAYAFHRFCTVRTVLRKPSLYKSYLGLCILSCIAFCMLDVTLFITYPLIFYTLILLFIEKKNAYDELTAQRVPGVED